MKRLIRSVNLESLLSQWYLIFLGAMAGMILGSMIYYVFPVTYKATASVIIDMNFEQSVPAGSDRDVYVFYNIEVFYIKLTAWSKTVLDEVSSKHPDIDRQELIHMHLELIPPGDGLWKFSAYHPDEEKAEALAADWAIAFVNGLNQKMEISIPLLRERYNLIEESQKEDTNAAKIRPIVLKLVAELQKTSGITHTLEYSLSQIEDISSKPTISQAVIMLGFSMIGAIGAVIILLKSLSSSDPED